jgi:hypothetical protein
VPSVTDSEPEPTAGTPEASGQESPGQESPEEKRARVMKRLAEIIRGDPPDLSGSGSGPVSAGGFPVLPTSADEFDQESAAELFAALGQYFERHEDRPESPDSEKE